MEVHHHSHPASGVTRKKWTHYFWEFLMLFLAVFCGFLAENQREHMIEHQREKKYIRSLYEDLKRDSATIVGEIDYRNGLSESARSLIADLDTADKIRFTDNVYNNAYHLTANPVFEYSNGTIEQLKHSGLFRLIRKKEVADNIIDYDMAVSWVFRRVEGEEEIRPEYRKAISELLNGKFLILFAEMDANNNYHPINLPFLSTGAGTVNRIKGAAAQLHNQNGIIINNLKGLLKKRNKLADLLRKEYYLN
jgi:hypothetical protein